MGELSGTNFRAFDTILKLNINFLNLEHADVAAAVIRIHLVSASRRHKCMVQPNTGMNFRNLDIQIQ